MPEAQVDFDALSTAEKILHVQDLWNRIADSATLEVEGWRGRIPSTRPEEAGDSEGPRAV